LLATRLTIAILLISLTTALVLETLTNMRRLVALTSWTSFAEGRELTGTLATASREALIACGNTKAVVADGALPVAVRRLLGG
jgi:hypothetical protein